MAAVPPRADRRRPRPGSVERPINGRLYRGTWLLVALPLLLAALSVSKPTPLPASPQPATFDRGSAIRLARDLATSYPNRVPGTDGALGAERWFAEQLQPYGFRTKREAFETTIAGVGTVPLVNLLAIAPGRSTRSIVVMAHRDNLGIGPGANSNASGTAALIELARAYAAPSAYGGARRAQPNFTIVFLSTDGGAFGQLGAAQFAAHSPYAEDVVAVVNLDSIAGAGSPRLEIAADKPRSPAASLVATAASALQQETGRQPSRPSALRQLVDLGFPFSLYGQAPFVARGIPALTLTTGSDRPPQGFTDTAQSLHIVRMGQLGSAAQNLLDSLDQGLDLAQGTSSYVFLGQRIVRGWAIQLILIVSLLPYMAVVVDLFARCRRRRVRLAPAVRSYRSRLIFWLWSGAVFFFFALVGVWPGGVSRPPAVATTGVQQWPALGIAGLAVLMVLGWLVSRERLLPRRPIRPEEELGGYTVALLALAVVALLVVATNPFALVFLLPSLHAWLWLPQARTQPTWTRLLLLAAGFAGPLLLLASFAGRYGLGLDAPWYIAELYALGYAPFPSFVIGLCWLAGAAQLVTLTAGRYAPYPSVRERPARGPVRALVRRAVLARRRRRTPVETLRARDG